MLFRYIPPGDYCKISAYFAQYNGLVAMVSFGGGTLKADDNNVSENALQGVYKRWANLLW